MQTIIGMSYSYSLYFSDRKSYRTHFEPSYSLENIAFARFKTVFCNFSVKQRYALNVSHQRLARHGDWCTCPGKHSQDMELDVAADTFFSWEERPSQRQMKQGGFVWNQEKEVTCLARYLNFGMVRACAGQHRSGDLWSLNKESCGRSSRHGRREQHIPTRKSSRPWPPYCFDDADLVCSRVQKEPTSGATSEQNKERNDEFNWQLWGFEQRSSRLKLRHELVDLKFRCWDGSDTVDLWTKQLSKITLSDRDA
jgi:hypothetical protein